MTQRLAPSPFAASVQARPSPAEGYDAVMYWPALQEYYGHSDFVNYGYWDETTHDARQAAERMVDKLLDWIPVKSGTILDVACGKGATTRHLLKHFPASAVTGINVSDRQLQTCRQNAPGCRFLNLDAADLKFPDASFENLICVEAAFHFDTRERFLAEALRVLKPGGRLVLSDMLLTEDAERRRVGRHQANYLPNPDAYVTLARRVGFADVHLVDATKPCLHGCFRHLVDFSHRRLLSREIDPAGLQAFCRHFFGFIPEIRYYLLAALIKR